MARMIEEGKQKGRDRLLLEAERQDLIAVLRRAANESEFLAQLAENPHEALKEYEALTAEERAALASGDIRRIEA